MSGYESPDDESKEVEYYNAAGFSTDYTNLETRFRTLLEKTSDMKPFRLFSIAWQEVSFYRVLWGRQMLNDKVEFFHELFNSLIQRLRSNVDDISKMLKTGRGILDVEIQAALPSLASEIFTVYGLYANIPANYSGSKCRQVIRVRITLDLLDDLANLLQSLLRQTVDCKLPVNHKTRRLVEELMAVFVHLKNSPALSVHIFSRFYLLNKSSVPSGRWATCKHDDQAEYLQKAMCDLKSLPPLPQPVQVPDKFSATHSLYLKCMSKLEGSSNADKNNPLMAETESLTAPTHMIQTSNEQLARVRGNIVAKPPPVVLPARVKRGRPRKPEDSSTKTDKVKADVKIICEEQEDALAIRAEFITGQIDPHIRILKEEDEEREREEWRIDYEQELFERDKRLQAMREEHEQALKENETKKRRKRAASSAMELSKKTADTQKAKRPSISREQNCNITKVCANNGQEIFPVMPQSEKGYHRLPKKNWRTVLPQEACVFSSFGSHARDESAEEEVDSNDAEDEVEIIKLEEVRSSDEDHIDPFEFVKIDNNQDKVIEGRIYVIDVDPPEDYQLIVRLGLLTNRSSEDGLKFTLVDNQKIHPRSNVGRLLKTEHTHTLSLSQVSYVVENLRYGDEISTRMFEEDYNIDKLI